MDGSEAEKKRNDGAGQNKTKAGEGMAGHHQLRISYGAAALKLGDGLRDIYDERSWFVQFFANLRLQF